MKIWLYLGSTTALLILDKSLCASDSQFLLRVNGDKSISLAMRETYGSLHKLSGTPSVWVSIPTAVPTVMTAFVDPSLLALLLSLGQSPMNSLVKQKWTEIHFLCFSPAHLPCSDWNTEHQLWGTRPEPSVSASSPSRVQTLLRLPGQIIGVPLWGQRLRGL